MYESQGVLGYKIADFYNKYEITNLMSSLTICLTANNNCLYNGAAEDSVRGPP